MKFYKISESFHPAISQTEWTLFAFLYKMDLSLKPYHFIYVLRSLASAFLQSLLLSHITQVEHSVLPQNIPNCLQFNMILQFSMILQFTMMSVCMIVYSYISAHIFSFPTSLYLAHPYSPSKSTKKLPPRSFLRMCQMLFPRSTHIITD